MARLSSQILACSWNSLLQSFEGEKGKGEGHRGKRGLGVAYSKGKEHKLCFLSCLILGMERRENFLKTLKIIFIFTCFYDVGFPSVCCNYH